MNIGDLKDSVAFGEPTDIDDGYGNVQRGFTTRFTVPAQLTYLRGGEEIIAQRMSGVQPVVIRVYASSETRDVDTGWRATNREGKTFQLKAITPDPSGRWIDFLAEAGTAA